VAERSEGLFLHLRFLDQVINKILVRNKSRMLVADALKRFASGPGGVYSEYCMRMHDEVGPTDYVKVLGGVVAVREPFAKGILDANVWG
jgi:hypothetical protein